MKTIRFTHDYFTLQIYQEDNRVSYELIPGNPYQSKFESQQFKTSEKALKEFYRFIGRSLNDGWKPVWFETREGCRWDYNQ